MYIEHGYIQEQGVSYYYLATECLDFTLYDFIKKNIENLSQQEQQTFLQNITVKLINSLQTFHSSGYVHQVIKPDNIMIRKPIHEECEINKDEEYCFINLKNAQEYIDKNGKHKGLKQIGQLQKITIFSSKNSLMMYELSRRDDLESLFLTMIYIIKKVTNNLEGLPYTNSIDIPRNFNQLQSYQQKAILMRVSEQIDQYLFDSYHSNWIVKQLISCIRLVRELAYEEKPDYLELIDVIMQKEPIQIVKHEEKEEEEEYEYKTSILCQDRENSPLTFDNDQYQLEQELISYFNFCYNDTIQETLDTSSQETEIGISNRINFSSFQELDDQIDQKQEEKREKRREKKSMKIKLTEKEGNRKSHPHRVCCLQC
eukprot:403350139